MVWACYAGRFKGPLVIWDPAWGTITSASYIEHIVPVIEEFNEFLWSKGIDACLMQDGAGAHRAYATSAKFYDRDINIEDAWHPSSVAVNIGPSRVKNFKLATSLWALYVTPEIVCSKSRFQH
ncbi:hypothetical protein N7528_002420 [Penicillium herquei]|nr:hypothetical protein N7528_002420 [Penicillium herquei]